jgi:diguanylate cyclase
MPDKSTILIADDDIVARMALEMLLEPDGYELIFATDGPEALEKAEKLLPDLILLDVIMPTMQGFEVCRRLRANPTLADLPIVMITGFSNRETRLQGIEAGADDVISKPYDQVELRARVRTITRLNRYRRLLDSAEKLNRLANYDALTNLPNRNLLIERITQQINHSQHQNQIFALFYIELRGLKQINETLGRLEGDIVLKQISQRLGHCCDAGETLARVVGNEFAILTQMSNVLTEQTLADRAQQWLDVISMPLFCSQHEIILHANVGISLYSNDGKTAEELFKHADTAKSRAKLQKRHGYQFFTVQMNDTALKHLVLQSQLRRAIENDELVLYFQPLLELNQDHCTISGVEVLVRWQHPDRGLLCPNEFIQVAEQSGLIIPLGEWVLRHACQQGILWQQQGFNLRISVNVSSLQFKQTNWLKIVKSILKETGFNPIFLELEITESLFLQDDKYILEILGDLRKLGIRLAIDDFGTGYSSLGYLRRFRLDTLKIDQSFIRDLFIEPYNAELVQGIVTLAHNLHLETVAEGVETCEQKDFLIKIGCNIGQGFLFYQPRPASVIENLLKNNLLTVI